MTEEQESGKAKHPPALYALAMVVCDTLWRDPWNGKLTIIGVHSAIAATEFPVLHPILTIYASLTDGRGKVPVRLRLVDANEAREPIKEVETAWDFPDPIAVVESMTMMTGLVFPEPGEYRVQLWCYDELVLERRIILFNPEAPREPTEPTP